MTTISISPLPEIMSVVGKPFILFSSAILNPPFEPAMVSITHYLIWSIAIVLLTGGLIAALTIKEKGLEGIKTLTLIGDIVIMLSLILFSVYTICMCVWVMRQYVGFYRWVAAFN